MRVLIDTNILISAAYSPNSTPHKAYKNATDPPNHGLICEQSLEEMRRVFNRKFPTEVQKFERFIATALTIVEVVSASSVPDADETEIRDIDDRSILRAAREAKADILLTGDKDFLESSITNPKIMTAAQFLQNS